MKPEKGFIKIDKSKFFYTSIGEGKKPVIFIPGWMAMPDSLPFKKILTEENQKFLKEYKIYFLLLSNFFKSSYSEKPMNLDDYSEELKKVLEKLKFEKVDLIGHSAGGRHIINFVSKYPKFINKVVLMNAAGLKPPKLSEDRIERAKFYFAKFFASSKEMENILKPTLQNLYSTDLTEKIKKIKKKTLIVWGEKDKEMKVKKAYKFKDLIKNSELKIFPKLSHMTINEAEVYEEIFRFLGR